MVYQSKSLTEEDRTINHFTGVIFYLIW